jgi:replicative DNA helicase
MPNNLEAERALLGSVLLDSEALDLILQEGILPAKLYSNAHQLILQRMLDLGERHVIIDLVTLSEELNRDGLIEKAGGAAYIAALTDGVPLGTESAVKEYCHIIQEKAMIRQAINVANNIIARALEGADDAKTIIELGQAEFFDLADERTLRGFVSIREAVQRNFGTIDALFERGGGGGLETGFIDLDSLTGGFRPGEFIIVAARPSMGKTAFALNAASHLTIEKKKAVGIFSLEMCEAELIMRLLCSEARVDTHKLRTGFASRDDWARMTTALGRLAEARLYIDDSPALTVGEIRAKARRLVAEHAVDLIIVDYLQLVKGEGDSREQQVSFVSRSLLALAKELKVPVLALSQMSRLIEQRVGGRPQLSDLRESGSIEQDAHAVIFIFRIPRQADADDGGIEGNVMGLLLAKQRNGPTGELSLVFLKPYVKFENRAVQGFDYDAKAAAAGNDR